MNTRIRGLLLKLAMATVAIVTLSSILIARYEIEKWPWSDRGPLRERHRFYEAHRGPLVPVLVAAGNVESARRVVVRCELENMAGSGGSSSAGGSTTGASTVIWVVSEGTPVKRGDVLARLDASSYEEMLRQQAIVVQQAKSSHLQARLDYEIAQLAVKEYLEGTVQQTVQQMQESIALSESDFARAKDHLEWTATMQKKGYASLAQLVTDKQSVATMELALQTQKGSYELFQRFTLPKTKKTLDGDVTTALTTMNNEYVKMQRQIERYKLLEKQVENCTIRAPQDGTVFYHEPPRRRGPNSQQQVIEEGASVRQKQELFDLPDLTAMEVRVTLNESVVGWLAPGLPAKVKFEAVHGLVLDGELVSINPIPTQQGRGGEEVPSFLSVVKLHGSAPKLKPGMTAEVIFELSRRDGVLTIPHASIVNDQGRPYCYLARGERLERQPITLGQSTDSLVEVVQGLDEGDEVLLDPPVAEARPRPLLGFGSPAPQSETAGESVSDQAALPARQALPKQNSQPQPPEVSRRSTSRAAKPLPKQNTQPQPRRDASPTARPDRGRPAGP